MSMPAASLTAPAARPAARTATVDAHDVNRIKLSWLLRLRWAAVVGQVCAITAAHGWLDIALPLLPLGALIALEIVSSAALELWMRRARVSESTLGTAIAFDAVLLTAILALTGGYWNPFATLYLVDVALAAVLLDAAWAWGVLAVGLSLFGALFALDHVGALHLISRLDSNDIAALHVQGMWIAFSVSAGLLVYIVQRVQRALTAVQQALSAERSLSARKDKVASLATLAAGAAHELSTPLSTIAVVVKELQRSSERHGVPPEAQEDLRLIRDQVDRCRDILHHMSAQAGENAGEPFVTVTLGRWVQEALEFLPGRDRVEVDARVDLEAFAIRAPPRAIGRALRSLVKNAIQASPDGARVRLGVGVDGGSARADVVDQGHGMPQEILSRAGEPFFTTKIPGEGMGLGLFLTQTLAEQLGGSFELSSAAGRGTTATLRLPIVSRQTDGGAP